MALSRRTFLAVMAAGLASCSPNSTPAADSSDDLTDPIDGPFGAVSSMASTAVGTTGVATSGPIAPIALSTTIPTTPVVGAPARFLNKGDRSVPAVALTFHAAGDVGRASRLLDVLKRSGTPVTIFAVGSWIQANPQLTKRMLADGHELANHTWSHGAMRTMSASQLDAEITRAAGALNAANGSPGRWFRPSQIDVPTEAILAAAGRAGYGVSVGYDVDTLDFQDPGAPAVRANAIAGIQPGSIVSLHFDHENTIEAMPAIIDHLKSKAWKPVTLAQLLG